MDKMAELHGWFVSGRVNGAVYSYLCKVASNDADLHLLSSHIEKMANLDIQSEADCQAYFDAYANVGHVLKSIGQSNHSAAVCKYAFDNRTRYDFSVTYNYVKAVLDFFSANQALIKSSHPNNMGIEGDLEVKPPYDLDKWVETMRYIYETANTNSAPLDSVTKQVTAQWDEDEQSSFQHWMRYYQEGNYGKYNVKTAQFFQRQQEEKTPNLQPVKDLFDTSAFPKPDPMVEKKRRMDEARKKLRGRLKSVEELVEQYRDVLPKDLSVMIRKDVYELKEKVLNLELKASIVDSLNRTSNQLKKHGFIEGASELKKIAQEVAEDRLPEVKESPVTAPAVEEVLQPKQLSEEIAKIPVETSIPTVDPTRSNIETPNFNDVSYREAVRKLEEINSVISERAVVRALAGVDIILSQLGIASYFAELAEAQSKLLDAFNYSAIRISRVISELRGRPLESDEKPKSESAPIHQPERIDVVEEMQGPVNEIIQGRPPAAKPPKVE